MTGAVTDGTDPGDEESLLVWARTQERRGDLEAAAVAYLQAGAAEDAARMYMSLGRFAEAGAHLLASIGFDRAHARDLDPARRRTAIKAANCLATADQMSGAIEVLLAMKERERAVDLLRRHGHHAEANRLEARPRAPEPTPPTAGPRLADGSVIQGRYRLDRAIGSGATAVVYQAFDLELDEPIAIKFFSPTWGGEGMAARFKQEVSVSRRFSHPNVVRLFDIGSHGDYKYITMELLDGESLRPLMRHGPLDLARGLDLLVQACAGLACVHDCGVIHRDIKPDNFFVTREGVLKVMDFGIAKRQSASRALTVAGMMAGTPHYMAPEQITNFAGVTHLADIYSLGCIAYEMFTGAPPFQHEEMRPLLFMHLGEEPEPPRARNPSIPVALEAVILRLLDKEPARRVAGCRELASILTELRARDQRARGNVNLNAAPSSTQLVR
jgi:serine/threonine-protein kinase